MGATRERGLDAFRTLIDQRKIKCQTWRGTRKDLSSSSKEEEMTFCKNLVRFLWSIVCIQAPRGPGAA